MASGVSLRLFVAGRSTPRSTRALDRLRAVLAEHRPDADLEVIDVLERPDLADHHRILATPTLVRLAPEPPARIIGDLASADRLLEYLFPEEVR